MTERDPFFLQKGNLYAVPALHFNMEIAGEVRRAIDHIKPDCIAVEFPETLQLQLLHAASRLPDVSIVVTYNEANQPLYFLCEPCDPLFEGLRSA